MTPNEVKIVANNIDDFIEVPNSINRLRRAVLTLAVSGKLVPQDIKEGEAEELYRKIQKEKLKISNKKIKEMEPISEQEVLFEIPKTWKWIRMGDIMNFTNGYAFKSSDYRNDGVGIVRIGNIQNGDIFESNMKYVSREIISSIGENFNVYPGDLLIAMSGATTGKLGFNNTNNTFVLNQRVGKLEFILVEQKYFYNYLSTRIQENLAISAGSAIPNLSTEQINSMLIPLPPLSEQKRIIKKVDEVMKQLDELEVKKQKSDETRVRLARSAMQSLGKGESKIAFENLAELIKTPDDTKELENALLALAVSGKLVSQDVKEGTAEELYQKIQKEKVAKKRKTAIPILEKEIPFDIPKSWKWVRLAELGIINTGKTPKTASSENFNGDIPFIGPGDFGFGRIVSHSKLITEKGASESQYAKKDDVLMVCIGGTIGKSALVDNPVTFNQQINKITLHDSIGKYLYYVFISKYFQALVWSKTTGGATPILNSSRWSECLIPLPPVAEQKRIVKKVDEIMVLINQLRDVIGGNKSQGRGRPKK